MRGRHRGAARACRQLGRLHDAARLLAAADGLAEQVGSTGGPADLVVRNRRPACVSSWAKSASTPNGRSAEHSRSRTRSRSHSKSQDERATRSLTSTNTPAHNDDRVDGQSERVTGDMNAGPEASTRDLLEAPRADRARWRCAPGDVRGVRPVRGARARIGRFGAPKSSR